MPHLVLALDAAAVYRDALGARGYGLFDLQPVALLAELAGIETVRVGIDEEQSPHGEGAVLSLRRSVRRLELQMPPSQSLLKVALEVRPESVMLAGDTRDPADAGRPVDLRGGRDAGLAPFINALRDAGIPVAARIHPDLDSVKAAHTLGLSMVELYAGDLLDLPVRERGPELERLGDAARIAAKLRIRLGIGGGVDFHNVGEILRAAPVAERISVGRALLGRALLVGIDRSVRDFRDLLR